MKNVPRISSFTLQLNSDADSEEVHICTCLDDPIDWSISFNCDTWTSLDAFSQANRQVKAAILALESSVFHFINPRKSK